MTGRLVKESGTADHRPAFRVTGAEDQSTDPGMTDRPGAHGAGLQRDIKLQTGKPVIPELLRGLAQGQDLGMGGRIMTGNRTVVCLRDNAIRSLIDNQRPDRRLARLSGGLRQA